MTDAESTVRQQQAAIEDAVELTAQLERGEIGMEVYSARMRDLLEAAGW